MIPVIEHDPEKWKPVSRLREARFGGRRKVGKDHAPIKHPDSDPIQFDRITVWRAICAGRRRSVNLAPRFAQSGQAIAFSRRTCARVLPTPLSKFLRSPIASCRSRRWDRSSARSRSDKPRKEKRKRNAGRRIVHDPHTYGVRGAPRRGRLAPPLRFGRARLPAFHHGTCGGDRTPPLSSSSRASWDGTR